MAVNIGPKIGIDGEAEYRKQINNIIQQAKTLDSEMKVVASTFGKNATAQEKAAKSGNVLAQQFDVQQKRVKLLADMLEKSAKKFGENDNATLKWKQAVNEATAQLNHMEREMKENASAADDLGDELKEGGKKAISFGDILKANILSDAIIGGFRALGGAIRSAVSEFANFTKEGIDLASDLEEVQNVVDTTFGDGSNQIEQFAKSAATSFGMSELSAKQFTGTIGAMFKSMGIADDEIVNMSTGIAGLAGDMASFYNLAPDEAFEKLRSGISGETEPLKQLGINMSVANLEAYALAQGITTAYKNMSQAEQATLRYNYIMQATADAQGDFAKTSGSYANQQRILQLNIENLSASLGQKLLPTINGFTTALNGLLSGNDSLYEFTQQISNLAVSALNSFSSALPGILQVGGQFISSLMTGIMEATPQLLGALFSVTSTLGESLATYLPIMADFGMDIITTLVSGIGNALPTLIPQAVEAIMGMFDSGIVGNLDSIIEAGFDLLIGLVEGILNGLPKLYESGYEMIGKLIVGLVENLPKIIEMGVELVSAIVSGIITTAPKLVESAGKMLTSVVQKFKTIDWKSLGKNIVQGIINGVKSMGTALWNAIKDLASNALNAAKDFLGIHSPSRVFEKEVGRQIPPGISAGVSKAFPAMVKKLGNQFAELPGLTVPKMNVPANNTMNMGGISINVYAAEGQNANQVAEAVAARIQSIVDRRKEVFA